MRNLLRVFAALLVIQFGADPVKADITITINYFAGASALQSDFEAAANTWKSLLLGYQSGVVAPGGGNAFYNPGDTVNGVVINVGLVNNPSYLGLGTVTGGVRDTLGFGLVTDGQIALNAALTDPANAAIRQNVILHEMAHVLGFGGNVWNSNGLIDFATGTYLGTHATAAYQAEFNQPGQPLKIENQGSEATAFGHWDENLTITNNQITGSTNTGIVDALSRDFRNELMTGWLDSPTFISNTTVQSFADIGFITAVPEPGSIALICVASSAFFARRFRSAAKHSSPDSTC